MKMNFNVVSSVQPAVASKAILLYTTQNRHSNDDALYATVHDLNNVGTDERPNIQIMPGSPISQESLVKMMGSLAEKYLFSPELMPENVLSFSPIHLVWWSPATKRRVFFNNKELGKRAAVVPHPPLLHIVLNRTWYVFGLKDNIRPTKATPLYHAPYFNIYDDGQICTGTAAIPDHLSTELIPSWEDAFFDSEFTHSNGQIRKAAHPRGEYSFWKEMLDGVYQDFPLEYLVDKGATVGSAMAGIRRTLGADRG